MASGHPAAFAKLAKIAQYKAKTLLARSKGPGTGCTVHRDVNCSCLSACRCSIACSSTLQHLLKLQLWQYQAAVPPPPPPPSPFFADIHPSTWFCFATILVGIRRIVGTLRRWYRDEIDPRHPEAFFPVQGLLEPLVGDGTVRRRSREELLQSLHMFTVVERESRVRIGAPVLTFAI